MLPPPAPAGARTRNRRSAPARPPRDRCRPRRSRLRSRAPAQRRCRCCRCRLRRVRSHAAASRARSWTRSPWCGFAPRSLPHREERRPLIRRSLWRGRESRFRAARVLSPVRRRRDPGSARVPSQLLAPPTAFNARSSAASEASTSASERYPMCPKRQTSFLSFP